MKPKDQGTRWETMLVRTARTYGLDAERLPESGVNDEGDLRINHWIVEAKHRRQLNIHDALHKAQLKAGDSRPAAVAWKRRVDTNRHPIIIAMSLHDFLELLGGK